MKFAAVGKCIYCGSIDRLSDEHIFPKGLHGDLVLPASSCEICRVETGKFEQRVLRGPLWPVRTELQLRTKRPRERPKYFPMAVVRDGVRQIEDVTVGQNLASVVLPIFGPPGFLTPDTPKDSIRVDGFYVNHINRTPEDVRQQLGAEGVWVESDYPVGDFARLVAKIAYAFAAAKLGVDRVAHPLVVPGILGRGTDLGQWVGGVGEPKAFPDPNVLHAVQLHHDGPFVTAAVQLFHLQPTPIYLVLLSKGFPANETTRRQIGAAQQGHAGDVRNARA